MNYSLHRSMHARGLTAQKLARLVGCGRAHLSQVLNNRPGRGGQTRRKLFPKLTFNEIVLLGWEKDHREWWIKNIGPFPPELEQSSTGNIVPAAQTP